MPVKRRYGQDGLVLMMVLVFALLLVGSVATLSRQAVIDSAIARNRENRERADGLARGGIELAKALILADKFQGSEEQALETSNDRVDHDALAPTPPPTPDDPRKASVSPVGRSIQVWPEAAQPPSMGARNASTVAAMRMSPRRPTSRALLGP